MVRPFQLAPPTEIFALKPAIDRVGGLLARQHRRHHHIGTSHAISACEHTGQIRLQCQRIGTQRSRFLGRQAQPFAQGIHIGDLANRGHHSVAGNDELRAWNRLRRWPSAGVGLTELHLDALKTGYMPAGSRLERCWCGQEHQFDAFALSILDLARISWHFCSGSAVHDRNFCSSATQSGTGRIQRGIASSHYQHTVSRRRRISQTHSPQELHAPHDARQRFPWNPESPFHVSPNGNENCRVAFPQFFEGDAATHRGVKQDFDPDRAQPVQLGIQQGAWQPKGRNADCQHPARHRQCLEDCRAIALLPELVGTQKAGWARSHDRNLLWTIGHGGVRQLVVGAVIGNESLQSRQIDRIVHVRTGAGGCARVSADATANGRNRVVSQNDLERLLEASLRDQGHIALRALMNGTSGLARRRPAA